ncbi:glycerophosphoryl diester phosphodiesterase membrane domain-containing protein [Streptomyces sp. ST2-7A]|uniref:DUF7544 domain-containing protein n=1 Tax=Streptomyces sp. ST2-7A TaxID=2907214 RepID=UPI001F2026C6|nr:glycerophosphoryl diester phosphodiesterase membrane domain-containing protein [Streptomyces sp. ST2-7A]MCE7082374.1 glycerophosphoryl diester phosphodiesterase membrane domain-containing protein [Streptomyces sp. ST2-7A]
MSDRWTSPGSSGSGDDPHDPEAGRGPNLDKNSAPPTGGGTPPTGWSAHPPAGGPGGPGWGAGPGAPGGPGWGGHSWAPKPGVIPLRPLGVGEILDGAVSTARAHWRTVLGISLAVAVFIQLISLFALRSWFGDGSAIGALEGNTDPTEEELVDAFADIFALGSVTGIATLVGSVIATAMLTVVIARAVLGREISIAEAWAESRGRLLRLFGLIVLTGLIGVLAMAVPPLLAAVPGFLLGGAGVVLIPLGLFAGVVLAVWLWIRFSLAAPALMLERQGVFASLGRSWKLVGGSWWRIFGIQLLILVLVLVVSGIIEFPLTFLAEFISNGGTNLFVGAEMTWTYLLITGAGAVISSTITLPISAGVTALLYMDQRMRREALDLELARAAGFDTPNDPGADGPGQPGY